MATIEIYFPEWRSLSIHESSPVKRGASLRLARECPGYVASQFHPDRPPGSAGDGARNEDLERLTFADEAFDLHITQDVLEHVFSPAKVFSEIARTLKPGGAHLFTVPLPRGHLPSSVRARKGADGRIDHLEPAVYHGNPVSSNGSLVTTEWGYDIYRHIFEASGLFTHAVRIDAPDQGIRAEYGEVLVTLKPPQTDAPNALR